MPDGELRKVQITGTPAQNSVAKYWVERVIAEGPDALRKEKEPPTIPPSSVPASAPSPAPSPNPGSTVSAPTATATFTTIPNGPSGKAAPTPIVPKAAQWGPSATSGTTAASIEAALLGSHVALDTAAPPVLSGKAAKKAAKLAAAVAKQEAKEAAKAEAKAAKKEAKAAKKEAKKQLKIQQQLDEEAQYQQQQQSLPATNIMSLADLEQEQGSARGIGTLSAPPGMGDMSGIGFGGLGRLQASSTPHAPDPDVDDFHIPGLDSLLSGAMGDAGDALPGLSGTKGAGPTRNLLGLGGPDLGELSSGTDPFVPSTTSQGAGSSFFSGGGGAGGSSFMSSMLGGSTLGTASGLGSGLGGLTSGSGGTTQGGLDWAGAAGGLGGLDGLTGGNSVSSGTSLFEGLVPSAGTPNSPGGGLSDMSDLVQGLMSPFASSNQSVAPGFGGLSSLPSSQHEHLPTRGSQDLHKSTEPVGRSERPPVDSSGKLPRYDPLHIPEMKPLERKDLVLYRCRDDSDWSQYLLRLTPRVLSELQDNSCKRLVELKGICGCSMAIRVDMAGDSEQRFLVFYRDEGGQSCQSSMTIALKVLNTWL